MSPDPSFGSLKEMIDFVLEVDNNRDLYLTLLAKQYFRNNTIPDYARDETIMRFFDRIFETALARRAAPRDPPGGVSSARSHDSFRTIRPSAVCVRPSAHCRDC